MAHRDGTACVVDVNDEQCPRPAAVDVRVRVILGIKSTEALEERAKLLRDGGDLRIVVTRKDRSVLGERVLSAAGSARLLRFVHVFKILNTCAARPVRRGAFALFTYQELEKVCREACSARRLRSVHVFKILNTCALIIDR
jgi:hypothetical protein